MNRRSFIGRVLGAVGAVLAMPFVRKAAGWEQARVFRVTSLEGREPIIITGPTPSHLIKGVPGISHVEAIRDNRLCVQVWLDGVPVEMRAMEADSVAGWVRMVDVDADGNFIYADPDNTGGFRRTIKVGGARIELPDRRHTIDRIHFGKVELRIMR